MWDSAGAGTNAALSLLCIPGKGPAKGIGSASWLKADFLTQPVWGFAKHV